MSESWVYFVQLGNRIKIGFSTNIKLRMISIPGRCLALVHGTADDEFLLHQQFMDLWDTGEWFRAEEPLLGYIAALPKRSEIDSLQPSLQYRRVFKRKVETTDAAAAIERAGDTYERNLRAMEEIDFQLAAAIKHAIAGGSNLREIGQRLHVSPETVRTMRDFDGCPKLRKYEANKATRLGVSPETIRKMGAAK